MQGNEEPPRPWAGSEPRTRGLAAGLLVVGLIAGLALIAPAPAAVAGAGVSQAAVSAAGTTRCGATVDPQPAPERQINLVLDDSGSMFRDDSDASIDRWSAAKYSLEVFAAMLEENDTLAVYRMSDFRDGARPGPTVTLFGTEASKDRVAKIHGMPLQGYGTPYAPVQQALADLQGSSAPVKWLVILSDGEFTDRATGEVQADLDAAVAAGRSEVGSLSVAFMAIGGAAPAIRESPGIHYLHAPGSGDVLNQMTTFSNFIFGRSLIDQSPTGTITPDIDLAEAIVFAQGPSVDIKTATTTQGSAQPAPPITVSWADNPEAFSGNRKWPADPNRDLVGQIAWFDDLPKGTIAFDVTGAQKIDVFYKPSVDFGVELRDATGTKVESGEILGGEYVLHYGFMNDDCEFIESDLLGDVEYSAKLYHDDALVADRIGSGEVVTLPRGDVILDAQASYLGGATSRARISLQVLRPALPAVIEAEPASFDVSRLGTYEAADGLTVDYHPQGIEAFTPEEWAAVTPDSFEVTSASNLEWDVVLGDEVGEVHLVPRAPGDDPYAATTGEMEVSIAASHVFDDQVVSAQAAVAIEVLDDLPWWDRALHWFQQIGWLFLLLALLLILIAGYVFKRRFSRRFSPRPKITGRYSGFGRNDRHDQGKFEIRQIRRFMPFAADTAVLKFTPGGAPFPSLRLKAGPSKTAIVENWRELQRLAGRSSVKIGNTAVDESTKRAPTLNSSMRIVAQTPEITYTTTLLRDK